MRRNNGRHILAFAALGVAAAALTGCPINSLLAEIQDKVAAYEESGLTVATPTLSPSAGTYSSDQSVTVSDTTDGAVIYYTTDGTTPTTDSTEYTGGISVAGNGTTLTIKAIAVKGSMKASEVATATYVISYSQVSTPTFSLSAGTYSSDLNVTISDTTDGAVIYYTTDGTTPTASSTKNTGAISVAGNGTALTIKAVAVKSGMADSTIASATYVIDYSQVSTPNFSPSAGTYSANQSVTISDSTSGATIYYTTDGSTPTTSSTKYTGAISVAGDGTTITITAIAAMSGMKNSTTVSATYTINYSQVSTPNFSPIADTYSSDQSVTISDSTSGATIYYTTDGSTPTTSSTQYTGAISVAGDYTTTTINAIAVKSGMTNSTIASAKYVIAYTQVDAPSFSISAGTYSADQSVTISDTTSGATIYYTTDGNTPTTSSTKYTGAISVAADGTTTTIRAIAVKSGMRNSATSSATYVIHYPITTPSGLALSSVTAGGLTASWTSTGAQSYQLYRSTSASGSYTQVYSGTSTSYTESLTLMPDTAYYYEIQATYAAGTSGFSSSVSATTLDCLYVTNKDSQTIQAFSMGTDGSLSSSATLSVSYAPNYCAVSPDYSYLYVTGESNSYIYVYKIGNGGALNLVQSCSAGGYLQDIAITPSGKYLYCADYYSGYVYAFSIDTSTGKLTALSTATYSTAGSAAEQIAITPNGFYLYVTASGTNYVYSFGIDSNTGALTSLTSTSTGYSSPWAVAVSPNGSFLYSISSNKLKIVPFKISSGALSAQTVATITGAALASGDIAISSGSTYLYTTGTVLLSSGLVYAYSINSSSGILTLINSYSAGTTPTGVVLDDDGTYLYVANSGDGTITSFSISSGALTIKGTYSAGSSPQHLAVH